MVNNQYLSLGKSIISLGKIPVSLAVAYTALAGNVMYSLAIDIKGILITLGVFFLSAGSAGFNQVQEKDTDRLMTRTKNRPVASGKISEKTGITISVGYFLTGLIILYNTGTLLSLMIAMFTVFWYNGIYTPLKKITPFAVFPGAIVGALPPLIGYTAAGGSLLVFPVLFLSVFLFMAQIPHFWLIIIKRAKEYSGSNILSVSQYLNQKQIKRLSIIWIILLMIASFTLYPAGTIVTSTGNIFLILISGVLFIFLIYFDFIRKIKSEKFSFILLNIYVFLILSIIIAERVIIFKLYT